MTPQEKDLIASLFDRLKQAAAQPKDPEAEALIRQAVTAQPDAPYFLIQTVIIQDMTLKSAEARLNELERELAEARKPAPAASSFLAGAGSVPSAGVWGPARSATPTPAAAPQMAGRPMGAPGVGYPPAQGQPYAGQAMPSQAYPGQPNPGQGYPAPGYGQPGYQQPSAMGGFLRSAAATAAGVAGGALLFQGISSMMGGHGGLGGSMASAAGAAGLQPASVTENITNNYYGDAGAAPSAPTAWEQGGAAAVPDPSQPLQYAALEDGQGGDPGLDAGGQDYAADFGGDDSNFA